MSRPGAFDGMMFELCSELGWCGSAKNGRWIHVCDFVPHSGSVSADEFARWGVLAEGIDLDQMDLPEIKRWLSTIKAVFVKHMGHEVVDASQLC